MSNNIEHPVWNPSTCIICDILAGEIWVPFRQLFTKEEAPSEILLESKNFAVIADIGPIVEGHCLILSKKHLASFACLEPLLLEELAWVKQQLRTALRVVYSEPIAFEHGEATYSKNAGSCIDHAHLHMVPSKVDLLSHFKKDFHFEPVADMLELRPLARKQGYLFYEDLKGNMHLAKTDTAPRQYFRQVLRQYNDNNLPWNWRAFVALSDILKTKEKIRNAREKLLPLFQRK